MPSWLAFGKVFFGCQRATAFEHPDRHDVMKFYAQIVWLFHFGILKGFGVLVSTKAKWQLNFLNFFFLCPESYPFLAKGKNVKTRFRRFWWIWPKFGFLFFFAIFQRALKYSKETALGRCVQQAWICVWGKIYSNFTLNFSVFGFLCPLWPFSTK